MTDYSPALLPLAVVAAMAGLTYWLNQVTEAPLPQDDAAFRHDPDLIVENFSATAYDRHGHPRHILTAVRLTHYMDDDTTELIAPRFEQRSPGAPVVRASATRGFVSSNGEHVHLIDQVRITREATPDTPELVMTTQYLHVTPEAELMRTDQPVELRQGASWMTAGSLYADGKSRTMELKGRVKGTYEIER